MREGKVLLGLVLLGMMAVSCAQVPGETAVADAGQKVIPNSYDTTGYSLVWSDEFSGSAVDTTKWSFDTGNGTDGWGNWELEYYQAANATVANGYLTITAKKESVGGYSYTSARLKTKGIYDFRYGKVVARMQLPTGSGLWPAFWMLGANIDSVGWPYCGEIDIMENIGSSTVYSTCHWWAEDVSSYANYGLTTTTTTSSFHDYEVEWTSSQIIARVDGVQYYVIDITPSSLSEFQNNFYMLLNLAVGGLMTGYTTPADSLMPASMLVDYVRVYQTGTSTTTSSSSSTTVSSATTVSSSSVSSTTTSTASSTATSTTFTYGVDYVSATSGKLWFKPGWTANWVDVHYKVNGGTQMNYVMAYNSSTAQWEKTATDFVSGATITYYYTYELNGLAYSSPTYTYTQSATASSSVASSAVSSSSVSSSSLSSSSASSKRSRR
ncbi:MAG: glycoside hydrolase family 16 protein [Sedimentisphaerales bacterium]|nr:glycoside hydrolase family 16 protein [Sedimentisphaerales bacterium]